MCLENNHELPVKTEIRFNKKSYNRDFFQCRHCGLVFLQPSQRVPLDFEKERYVEHENDIAQQGYRDFLMQMWVPLKEKLKFPCEGLDYGCGPTEAFAALVAQEDVSVDSYDPFFAPDGIQKKTYDFVWFNEAIEHCYDPRKELETINSLMKNQSHLAVGTTMLNDFTSFADWNYHKDITHITFFQERTFEWVAQKFGWTYEKISYRVHLFSKNI